MRRQLQANGINGEKPLYNGAVDCFNQILKREGVAGFYRGLPVNVVKYLTLTLTLTLTLIGGLPVNVVKCIPEAGIQFASYDPNPNPNPNPNWRQGFSSLHTIFSRSLS